MAWTSPKTWVVDEILGQSDLNTYVRDNELSLSSLTSYTPTWTASTTNPTIGNGSILGRYVTAGDWVWVWIGLTIGTTTTVGSGIYVLTAPVAGVASHEQYMDANFLDLPSSRYRGVALLNTGSVNINVIEPTVWSSTGLTLWNNVDPFVMASTDTLYISGMYRRN